MPKADLFLILTKCCFVKILNLKKKSKRFNSSMVVHCQHLDGGVIFSVRLDQHKAHEVYEDDPETHERFLSFH